MKDNNINMQKLLAKSYNRNQLVNYMASIDKPLAMIYQSGYLTIKSYDIHYNEYMLDFPNVEVQKGFAILTANTYIGDKSEDINS